MVAGVPIANFINNTVSYEMAMAFFAIVNAIVFIGTLIFVPSLPVEARQSYGSQVRVLRKSVTWISIIAVILFNAAVFGVYSYLAEYLEAVTHLPSHTTTLALFLFGGANIIGNIIAGKGLSLHANKSVIYFPLLLGITYIILSLTGQFAAPMLILTLIWGIFAGGLMANINQYLISSSAPEAPFFANGLFVSACNIGTTLGSSAGGLIISAFGIQYVVLVGIISVVIGMAAVLLRKHKVTSAQLKVSFDKEKQKQSSL